MCLVWFAGWQIMHGFFQATGGPVNTAIMNNWWPKEGRGKIFGFWTCHQYVGDIVAAFAGECSRQPQNIGTPLLHN